MIFLALTFLFGAFFLQQMPLLSGFFWALAIIPLLLFNIRLAYVNQHFLTFLKRPALILSSFLFVFFWAATFAIIRLADELPAAWENKPI